MALRTQDHIVEEYNAARAAKLKILDAQQAGIGDKAILRAKLKEVNEEIRRLSLEHEHVAGTGGIAINTGIKKR